MTTNADLRWSKIAYDGEVSKRRSTWEGCQGRPEPINSNPKRKDKPKQVLKSQINELTSRNTDGYPKGRSSSTTVDTEDGTRLQINEFTEFKA